MKASVQSWLAAGGFVAGDGGAGAHALGERGPALPQVRGVQQGRPGVIARTGGEVARGRRRVVKDPFPLDQQAQGRQRVQQHLGGARVGAEPGGHVRRAGALAHGREQVEFQRREDGAALLKRADALVQLVGEDSGGFAGAARRQHLFAVVQDLRAQVRRRRCAPGAPPACPPGNASGRSPARPPGSRPSTRCLRDRPPGSARARTSPASRRPSPGLRPPVRARRLRAAAPRGPGPSPAPRSTARLRASAGRRQTRETGTAPCFFSGFTVTDSSFGIWLARAGRGPAKFMPSNTVACSSQGAGNYVLGHDVSIVITGTRP